ncbi:MAG: hypothetical protein WBA18_03280 [Terracidiphilus sp.]
MKTVLLVVSVCALVSSIPICGRGQSSMPMSQMSEMHKPAVTPGPLKIIFGDKSSEWTPVTLSSLPHKTITVHNEHTKAEETYSGVQLIDLLTPLGVSDKPHGKDLRLYLVAAGSDGYEAVYSIGEITPDVNNSTVIVADSENGKPLADDGPLKLVATNEKRPTRWVRNLVAIRVMAAN